MKTAPDLYLVTTGGKWRVMLRRQPVAFDPFETFEAAAVVARKYTSAETLPVWDADRQAWAGEVKI